MIDRQTGYSPGSMEFMATRFRISRVLSKATQSLAGKALRFMVVLSLWHAPIPWVHVHELEGPQVERLASLSQHVADFHARELSWGATRLDWHTHLVLPWCMSHQHDCPSDGERNPGSDDILGGATLVAGGQTSSQSLGQPTARAFLSGEIVAGQAAVAFDGTRLSALSSGQARCLHFFETYGSSVAVRDLVSVRLC